MLGDQILVASDHLLLFLDRILLLPAEEDLRVLV